LKTFTNLAKASAFAQLLAPMLALTLASSLAACGASDAAPTPPSTEEFVGKIPNAMLIGEKSGVTQMTINVTITLDPNDKDKTSKSVITQYFVWDNWGKKTAKYQLHRTKNTATKPLMRVNQSGATLSMGEPSGLVNLIEDEFNPTVPRIYDGLSSYTPDQWTDDIYTELLVKAGFERTGQMETIKDRECEMVTVSVRSYCMWKGLTLTDEINNAVTQAFGLTEGIYLGEVDPRHFERGELAWPNEVIADLEGYAYE